MLLYLLRSLRRRPLRHLSLFRILLCAFLLPLVVSVYRDSLIYGTQCQSFAFHRGQAIHISGAQPEDTALFRGIDGLTDPFYEDGVVYITFSSPEDRERLFDDTHNLISLDRELRSRARQSSRALEVTTYDVTEDPTKDPEMIVTLRQMQVINLALLLFSGLIVQAAYRSHIASFSRELADISAIGASRGQILRFFLMELLLLFPPAAAGAVGISYGVMRLLYEHYLGNTAASAAIWQVFHMDPGSTAGQIGFYLPVCLGAMAYALLKKPARVRTVSSRKEMRLPRLWVRRTGAPFVSCLVILLPLLTAFVLLFNLYLSSYAKMVYDPMYRPITLSNSFDGFSPETADSLSDIRGVDRVEGSWDFSEPYLLRTPGFGSVMVSIHLAEELPEGMPELKTGEFLCDLSGASGSDGTYSLCRIAAPGKSVTVTPRLWPDAEDSLQSTANVYVSRDTLVQLGYTRLLVYTAPAEAAAVEAALLQRFPVGNTLIFNYQNHVDATVRRQEGLLWLLSWIFCILMLAAMQIVRARLTGYVAECGPMLRTVRQVGASRRQLSRLIPTRYGAVPAAILPFAIALPWAWLDARSRQRPFILSVPVLGIYALIAALAVLTFRLPVRLAMKKVLNDTI